VLRGILAANIGGLRNSLWCLIDGAGGGGNAVWRQSFCWSKFSCRLDLTGVLSSDVVRLPPIFGDGDGEKSRVFVF
jgi:hypothetical protein